MADPSTASTKPLHEVLEVNSDAGGDGELDFGEQLPFQYQNS